MMRKLALIAGSFSGRMVGGATATIADGIEQWLFRLRIVSTPSPTARFMPKQAVEQIENRGVNFGRRSLLQGVTFPRRITAIKRIQLENSKQKERCSSGRRPVRFVRFVPLSCGCKRCYVPASPVWSPIALLTLRRSLHKGCGTFLPLLSDPICGVAHCAMRDSLLHQEVCASGGSLFDLGL
jgi:hypothetical protein